MRIHATVFVSAILMALATGPGWGDAYITGRVDVSSSSGVSISRSVGQDCGVMYSIGDGEQYLPYHTSPDGCDNDSRIFYCKYLNTRGTYSDLKKPVLGCTKCKDGYQLASVTVAGYSPYGGGLLRTQYCVSSHDCVRGQYWYSGNSNIGIEFGNTNSAGGGVSTFSATTNSGGAIIDPSLQSGCKDCPSITIDGVAYATTTWIGKNGSASDCFVPAGSDSTGTYVWTGANASDNTCQYN